MDFVAQRIHNIRGWADEDESRLNACFSEAGILREESVSRMDGIDVRLACGIQDIIYIEVALGRRRLTDGICCVGHRNVHGAAIRLGVDRNRGNAQLAAGLDNSDRNLPAVGN